MLILHLWILNSCGELGSKLIIMKPSFVITTMNMLWGASWGLLLVLRKCKFFPIKLYTFKQITTLSNNGFETLTYKTYAMTYGGSCARRKLNIEAQDQDAIHLFHMEEVNRS